MKQNSVVLLLGQVHSCSANHDIHEFNVRVYNTLDMLPHTQGEYNDEDTPSYLEGDKLDEILENLRNNISICYHGAGISETIREEDSK